MEINQLRYLVALSKTKNFSRAAEISFVTQPTLSQQIKKLEDELGVQLFTRTTKSVELTPIGEQCLVFAERVLQSVHLLYGTVEESKRKSSGSLKVGVLFVYPDSNISNALELYREMFPEIETIITFDSSASLLESLLMKELDAIISNIAFELIPQQTEEMLQICPFIQDSLHVVLSAKHPLAASKSLAITDFCKEHFFFTDEKSSVKLLLDWAIEKGGCQTQKTQLCPSMTMLFNFVEAGMGISVMSRHVAAAYMRPGLLCIPVVPSLKTYTALITIKKSKSSQIVEDFRTFFLSQIDVRTNDH